MTEDHKPNLPLEKKRIEAEGGAVANIGGVWRCIPPKKRNTPVTGLAVSRGLGDKDFKNPDIVSAEPDLVVHDLDWDGDEFVILASDGIWDAVSDKDAVRLVQYFLRGGATEETAAAALVKKSEDKGCRDDKTAIVVRFGWVSKKSKQVVEEGAAMDDTGDSDIGEDEDGEEELDGHPDAELQSVFDEGLTLGAVGSAVEAGPSEQSSRLRLPASVDAELSDSLAFEDVSGGARAPLVEEDIFASASAAGTDQKECEDEDDMFADADKVTELPSLVGPSQSVHVGGGLFDGLGPTLEEQLAPNTRS